MSYQTVQSQEFANRYPVDINTLGSFYEKEKTLFRLYSPMADSIVLNINNSSYEMKRLENGVYEIVLFGDYEKAEYNYINDKGIEFTDPFSYCDRFDRKKSYVLDLNKLLKEKIVPKKISALESVVYETSVRDFTSFDLYPGNYPKKFRGLIEEGLTFNGKKIGFDYIKELGITHLQLMPVFDFDLDKTQYNWGYNPLSYNSLYQKYSSSIDPYLVVGELREVADKLHENDLRLVLDVVFNHVYRIEETALGKSLPDFCIRYTDKGKKANGTFCGNEIRTEAEFIRNYFDLMVKRYIDIFDIDGLRFDLMGILDIKTMNQIAKSCKQKKDDFLLLGEAWNMGDVLSFEDRACLENHEKLKDFHFFNNYFRETVKQYCADKIEARKNIASVLGSLNSNLPIEQTINYVECHDNATYYDYLKMNCQFDDYETLNRKAKLALALTILSRGIPFIHSGQEFLRTKRMIDNTYNLPDEINMINWGSLKRNEDVAEYAGKMLKIRHFFKCFSDENAKVSFESYYEVLVYHIDNLTVLINPCIFDHIYKSDKLFKVHFKNDDYCDEIRTDVDIKAHSVVIIENHTI